MEYTGLTMSSIMHEIITVTDPAGYRTCRWRSRLVDKARQGRSQCACILYCMAMLDVVCQSRWAILKFDSHPQHGTQSIDL